MQRCLSDDRSELDLFFNRGRFERAVHRGISNLEMPTTVVVPRDRSRFAIRPGDGAQVVRTDLPEGISIEILLLDQPEVHYIIDGNVIESRQFRCGPLKPVRRDESNGGQI